MAKDLECAWCFEPAVGKRECPDCGMKANGKFLISKWEIPVNLNRYHRDGNWWEEPHTFPCSFSDPSGYVIFQNLDEINSSEFFSIAKNSTKVNLTNRGGGGSLRDVPGYVGFSKPTIKEILIEEDWLPEKIGPEGCVYLITNEVWDGWVKVGSSFSPDKRLKNYQTGDPHRMYQLEDQREFSDRIAAESAIHDLLKSKGYQYEGEWFKISTEKAIQLLHNFANQQS